MILSAMNRFADGVQFLSEGIGFPNLTEADIREAMEANRPRLLAIAEAVRTVLAAKPAPTPRKPQ